MENAPIKVAPSILSADFSELGAELKAMDTAGADYIHLDVMDGHFVPNITFGPKMVKNLRPYTAKTFDVHLMISNPAIFLKDFAEAGADIITIHPEADAHFHRSLQTIKALGKRAGLALNPATPLNVLDHVMDLVDLILIMTVNPGFGGQSYIPLEDKIGACAARIQGAGRCIDLEVDGGVSPDTAPHVKKAGANVLVAGTAAFKGGPSCYAANIAAIRGA